MQLNRAAAGPYALSVWTQPSPPRAGPWRVDVAVMREGGVAVGDAAVRVRAEPVDGAARLRRDGRAPRRRPLGVRYRASAHARRRGPLDGVGLRRRAGGAGGRSASRSTSGRRAAAGGPGRSSARPALVLMAAVTGRPAAPAGVAVTVGLLLLLPATPAWPHASLVRSSPARRATLATAPDRVQLWFNEAIEPKFSSVSVWDAAGQQVDLGDARVEPEDPKRLIVGVKPLVRGTYKRQVPRPLRRRPRGGERVPLHAALTRPPRGPRRTGPRRP